MIRLGRSDLPGGDRKGRRRGKKENARLQNKLTPEEMEADRLLEDPVEGQSQRAKEASLLPGGMTGIWATVPLTFPLSPTVDSGNPRGSGPD